MDFHFFSRDISLSGELCHFSLLGGTSSILRTFLGGTSKKKHPVVDLREERHKGKRASATVTGCQTGKTGSTHFFGGAVSCGDGYWGS